MSLCGKDGLLRELRSTVILSGYLPEFLDVADQLILLDGNGGVACEAGYSYGEKQLLGIARAVVRRRLTGCGLLLVDKSSEREDPWRDQVLREVMREYFRGCTIIVVAQRQESIVDSNITLHMANGLIQQVRDYF
ncbi:hypothetical protein ACQRIU_001871 [Beauveria bassiana]